MAWVEVCNACTKEVRNGAMEITSRNTGKKAVICRSCASTSMITYASPVSGGETSQYLNVFVENRGETPTARVED